MARLPSRPPGDRRRRAGPTPGPLHRRIRRLHRLVEPLRRRTQQRDPPDGGALRPRRRDRRSRRLRQGGGHEPQRTHQRLHRRRALRLEPAHRPLPPPAGSAPLGRPPVPAVANPFIPAPRLHRLQLRRLRRPRCSGRRRGAAVQKGCQVRGAHR